MIVLPQTFALSASLTLRIVRPAFGSVAPCWAFVSGAARWSASVVRLRARKRPVARLGLRAQPSSRRPGQLAGAFGEALKLRTSLRSKLAGRWANELAHSKPTGCLERTIAKAKRSAKDNCNLAD